MKFEQAKIGVFPFVSSNDLCDLHWKIQDWNILTNQIQMTSWSLIKIRFQYPIYFGEIAHIIDINLVLACTKILFLSSFNLIIFTQTP